MTRRRSSSGAVQATAGRSTGRGSLIPARRERGREMIAERLTAQPPAGPPARDPRRDAGELEADARDVRRYLGVTSTSAKTSWRFRLSVWFLVALRRGSAANSSCRRREPSTTGSSL